MVLPSIDGERPGSCRISVEYEWLPHRCGDCRVFGHRDQACPRKQKPVVQKQGKHISVFVEKTSQVAAPLQGSSSSGVGVSGTAKVRTSDEGGSRKDLGSPAASRSCPKVEVSSQNTGACGGTVAGIDLLRLRSTPVYSVVTTSDPICATERSGVGGFEYSPNRFAPLVDSDGDDGEEVIEVDDTILLSSGPIDDAARTEGVK